MTVLCKLKFIAGFLSFLLIFGDSAFLSGVKAASESSATQQKEAIITLDRSDKEKSSTQIEQPGTELSNSTVLLTDKDKALQFGNHLISYYMNQGKNAGPAWLKTTEIGFLLGTDLKPIYSFETIQPFGGIKKDGQVWFWQGRYAYEGNGQSNANLGSGWRKLSADKTSMIGLNTFYDYGFQYNLARVGLGLEYFNKQMEYRANWYYPLSSDRQTGVNYQNDGILYNYIRAVEGADFELGRIYPG